MILEIYHNKGEKPFKVFGGDFNFCYDAENHTLQVCEWGITERFDCQYITNTANDQKCFAYEK